MSLIKRKLRLILFAAPGIILVIAAVFTHNVFLRGLFIGIAVGPLVAIGPFVLLGQYYRRNDRASIRR